MPKTIYMTGTDSSGHARFYRAFVTADLFGGWSLVREWGRCGSAGQCKVDWVPELSEALKKLQQLAYRKIRQGFQPVASLIK